MFTIINIIIKKHVIEYVKIFKKNEKRIKNSKK